MYKKIKLPLATKCLDNPKNPMNLITNLGNTNHKFLASSLYAMLPLIGKTYIKEQVKIILHLT